MNKWNTMKTITLTEDAVMLRSEMAKLVTYCINNL
jgi:hypothetical protein